MTEELYFDLQAGCSGDMFLASLVDIGADPDRVRLDLSKLDVSGYELEFRAELKGGVMARRCLVHVSEHGHEVHHHSHHHRDFIAIRGMIETSEIPVGARERSLDIFSRLAEAEAKIHGCQVGEVAFHEVGGVDSIVDIVGIALALDQLKPRSFHCSPVNVGSGTVKTKHGVLPVPAPATVELLKGFPVYSAHFDGETTTPTGAAVLASLVKKPGKMPAGTIIKTGYGAGSKSFPEGPNVLRAVLIQTASQEIAPEEVVVLECNLDDHHPEILGDSLERMMRLGALDVYFTAVQMKKNRPGVLLTVVCRLEDAERFTRFLLEETPTFGVRKRASARTVLARWQAIVPTAYGDVEVKAGSRSREAVKATPEFEACRAISERENVPLWRVYQEVTRSIAAHWEDVRKSSEGRTLE